jgi:hypothetical protein
MNAKWNNIVITFVFLALLHLVLDTTPSISENFGALLLIFDGIITMVFITDFVFKFQAAKDRFAVSKDVREFINGELLCCNAIFQTARQPRRNGNSVNGIARTKQ